LHATSTQTGNCATTCIPNDGYTQNGYSGTFSFIDNGGGAAQGHNLLSGTFAVTGSPSITGASFTSNLGSSAAGFNASASPGNLFQLVLTSDYIVFTGQTSETASFSLSSLNPTFSVGTITAGQAHPAAGPFLASGDGTFSSTAIPGVAPELASLGLIGAGLGALVFLRRRSRPLL